MRKQLGRICVAAQASLNAGMGRLYGRCRKATLCDEDFNNICELAYLYIKVVFTITDRVQSMLGCEVNPNTNRPAKRANMAEGHINQSLYLLILGAKTGSVESRK